MPNFKKDNSKFQMKNMAYWKKKNGNAIDSPLHKEEETVKGGLSWGTAMDQLRHGKTVDVWKDAKEKKAAKEQSRKDKSDRAHAYNPGGMSMI